MKIDHAVLKYSRGEFVKIFGGMIRETYDFNYYVDLPCKCHFQTDTAYNVWHFLCRDHLKKYNKEKTKVYTTMIEVITKNQEEKDDIYEMIKYLDLD